jgi:hypothetical protein
MGFVRDQAAIGRILDHLVGGSGNRCRWIAPRDRRHGSSIVQTMLACRLETASARQRL